MNLRTSHSMSRPSFTTATPRLTRWLRIACTGALLTLMTCGKSKTFAYSVDSTLDLEAGPAVIPVTATFILDGFSDLTLANNQELKNQGISPSRVESLYCRSLALEIADPPSSEDLTFVQNIAIYVEATDLPRRLIAHGGTFAQGARRVELTVEDTNIIDYAKSSAMNVVAEVTGFPPAQHTVLKATADLEVGIDVPGAFCDKLGL